MHKWHNEPHVLEWYYEEQDMGTLEAVETMYAPYVNGQEKSEGYIILINSVPAGFIQTYLISDYPDYNKYVQADEHAAGLDLFIGEADLLHKGFGPKIIEKFLNQIVFSKPRIQSCIIGPEPKNLAAIKAYQKAGFEYFKTIQCPNEPEPEYLMKTSRV